MFTTRQETNDNTICVSTCIREAGRRCCELVTSTQTSIYVCHRTSRSFFNSYLRLFDEVNEAVVSVHELSMLSKYFPECRKGVMALLQRG